MKNPGVRTLVGFLRSIQTKQPVNRTGICDNPYYGYSMVGRYIKYCLKHKFIRVARVERGRRNPSRLFEVTNKGEQLLEVFPLIIEEADQVAAEVKRRREKYG